MRVVIAQCDTLPPALPAASQANPTDTVVLNQSGTMRTATVAQLAALVPYVANDLTTSGTTQATALPLTALLNIFQTVGAGSGGRLQAFGPPIVVMNYSGVTALIWPPVGHQISSGSSSFGENNPITVPSAMGTTVAFYWDGGVNWYAVTL